MIVDECRFGVVVPAVQRCIDALFECGKIVFHLPVKIDQLPVCVVDHLGFGSLLAPKDRGPSAKRLAVKNMIRNQPSDQRGKFLLAAVIS